MTLPEKHRKTCKRWNNPGDAHYLTFSCYLRRPFLSKDRSRQWAIDAIALAISKHQLNLWAWVIMPEHMHILVQPRPHEYSISDVLHTIKLSVSRKAIAYLTAHNPAGLAKLEVAKPATDSTCITGATGLRISQTRAASANPKPEYRFWQAGGGYDRNERTHNEIREKIDYIHLNPFRRGLVTKPTDWPWSSARNFAGIATGPLPIDFSTIPKT